MTEEYINEITLKYLLNPSKIEFSNNSLDNLDKEIKFYKKRINQITKDMGRGEYPNNSIKNLYLNYASQIIYYLKNLDHEEIIQQEYFDLSLKKNENLDKNLDENLVKNLDENLDKNFNKLTINSNEKSNLNNFVKKIKLKEDEKIIPQKKNVNIKDDKFKTKGVKKNLNII